MIELYLLIIMKSYTPKTYNKRGNYLESVSNRKGITLEKGTSPIGRIIKFSRGRIVRNNP